jgi:hypothetical protein
MQIHEKVPEVLFDGVYLVDQQPRITTGCPLRGEHRYYFQPKVLAAACHTCCFRENQRNQKRDFAGMGKIRRTFCEPISACPACFQAGVCHEPGMVMPDQQLRHTHRLSWNDYALTEVMKSSR